MTGTPTLVRPPEPIRSPLEKLRGTIRQYVVRDGLLALGIFVALWFWIGLALDFGSFKLFAFDWVQELPRWFRGLLLVGFLGTATFLVIGRIFRRLLVEFRPDALALVLERKFPDLLGDRLITAVELADVERAECQGYSRSLIEETVREAEERVAQVDVSQAFDWARLRRMTWWLIGLVVGPFVLFGAVYSASRQSNPVDDYLPRFRETATIWTKRNLFLSDVIWPRKAFLDVLDFPVKGELRVGRDAASPRLRFKAHRWMIADAGATEGWRPMVWTDLRPGLIGETPPELPAGWLEPGLTGTRAEATRAASLVAAPSIAPLPAAAPARAIKTLDEVEQALEDDAVRARYETAAPESYAAVRRVFEMLEARAGDASSRSTYRRLEVPERIEVKYWGAQSASRMELLRGPGWEYAGTLSDLKESIQFRARGADYYTATRSIVLVPPPGLQQLRKFERRPAYLYHRAPLGAPPEGGPTALKGLRQLVIDFVSLNGPTSRVSVPAGTDLVLEGQLDKELAEVRVRRRGPADDSGIPAEATATLSDDRTGFTHRFPAVAGPIDVDFEFLDTDGVRSTRHVFVDAVRDLPPTVNVTIDGLRRTNQGHFLATPIAMIPFDGKVFDGQAGQLGGLDRIDYQLSLTRLETASAAASRAEWLTGALLPAVGGRLDSLALAALAGAETTKIIVATSPTQADRTFPLTTFQDRMKEYAARDVLKPELLRRLELPPGTIPLIREFVLQPKFEWLDLRERLPELKVRGELEVQPRYRMKLTVQAADNNIETGPNVATNKEPPFNVMIVSETELLVEVARDEEAQHVKADDAVARIREVRAKLDTVAGELPKAEPPQLATFVQRAVEMNESTVKARDIIQEVSSEYARILRELELNRVTNKFIEKVKGEICLPLESILKGEFVAAEDALEKYQKELEAGRKPDAAPVRAALDRLIARLEKVMAAMGEMATLNKLITTLQEIEKAQEQAIGAKLRELQRLQRERLIRDLDKLKGIE